MKLGILICDHVQEQLQAEFGDYQTMFKDVFSKINQAVCRPDSLTDSLVNSLTNNPATYPPITLNFFSVVDGEFPENIDVCDAYITTGSKYSINDDNPWIQQLIEFVKTLYSAKKGFVGICFGHQLIAKALGGKVIHSTKGWGIGIAESQVIKQQKWMKPYQASLNLIVSHQDQVIDLPTLSKNTEVLLTNDFCPNSMIQVDQHFLGLQGYPEFSAAYSFALMESRKDHIPKQCFNEGKKSLVHKADDLLVIQWIINFLQQTID